MPHCNVSISWDLTVEFGPAPPFMKGHNYVPAPPPLPPPTPAPAAVAYELPATQFWPPGMGSHKQTTTVKHRMQSISLDGHDLGRMIVHIPSLPAPNNALLPLILFKSSRKNNFKAQMVKMNGTPTGCFILLNLPPMPMTSCSDPFAIPTACSPMSWINSVKVGMSWASYLIAAVTLAANVLIDRFLARRDAALGSGLDAAKEARKKVFAKGLITIEDPLATGLKSAVAAASSIARLAFTNEDGSFPLIAGAPFGVEITRTADGTYGVKGEVTLSKNDKSVKLSAGGAEDGSMEGGVSFSKKSKDGTKDKYGQESETESSVGLSGKKDKDGKVEVGAEAGQKTSEGNEKKVAGKYENDPATGSKLSGEVSTKDSRGTEGKVAAEHSHDAKTGESTNKLSGSGNSAVGSAEVATEDKRDASGNVTETTDSITVKPTGGSEGKAENKQAYPATPKPGEGDLTPTVNRSDRLV